MMNLLFRKRPTMNARSVANAVDKPVGYHDALIALDEIYQLESQAMVELRAAQQRLGEVHETTVPPRPALSRDEIGKLRSVVCAAIDRQADCQRRASEQRKILDGLRPEYARSVQGALMPYRREQARSLLAKLKDISALIDDLVATDSLLAEVGIGGTTRMLPAGAFIDPLQKTAAKIEAERV